MTGRTLLIGGTGFLGTSVARRLADRRPRVLVRPTSDRRLLPSGVDICDGDLDRPASLPLDDIDTLVYCASMGFGHIPGLLDRLQSSTVRRAVFVSTTAIFTTLPAASRAPRLAAEAAVLASRLDWTILRPTMIYGTARDRNIARLLRFLRRWPVFPLCGNALWQPVHVDDLADAVVAALDRPVAVGQIYNLAGGDVLSFADLLRTAARAVGRRVVLVPVPVEAAVLAARLTGVVRTEQIRRLAEDKTYSYVDAARDLSFAPRTFAIGVHQQAIAMGLAPGTRAFDTSALRP
jgi:uncharacterized protein YbjT (DUF2867 family)